MKKQITMLLLFSVLCSSCVVMRPVTRDDYRTVSMSHAFGAVIPGLAQALNGEWIKAIGFSAGFYIPALLIGEYSSGNNAKAGFETQYYICRGVGTTALIWNIVDGIGTTYKLSEQRAAIDHEIKAAADIYEVELQSKRLANAPFSDQEKEAIKSGQIFIGMSRDAMLFLMGDPKDINTSVGDWGVHEQFVFMTTAGKPKYIYVENGFVTAWQE